MTLIIHFHCAIIMAVEHDVESLEKLLLCLLLVSLHRRVWHYCAPLKSWASYFPSPLTIMPLGFTNCLILWHFLHLASYWDTNPFQKKTSSNHFLRGSQTKYSEKIDKKAIMMIYTHSIISSLNCTSHRNYHLEINHNKHLYWHQSNHQYQHHKKHHNQH